MFADGRVTFENDAIWALIIDRLDLMFPLDRAIQNNPLLAKDLISYGLRDYRQFLYLLVRYPNTPLVPSKLVDLLWHEHILDTRNYERDCLLLTDIAGVPRFIHHNPRVMPGEAKHGNGMADRNRLLQLHFGVPHPHDIDHPNGRIQQPDAAIRLDVQCDTEGFGGSDCGGNCA